MTRTVAIIGGGVTGLTAAFWLQQRGIPVALYEASGRVGGVIRSVRRDGYLAEFGPNTILETSPKIISLVRDLGLDSRRMYSDPAAEKRYLVRDQKLVEVPASPPKFFTSPLFSLNAKLRLLIEPFRRRGDANKEESVAEFVRRRLGQEFLDYAINPLVAGIYAGDPERLSVLHAFPKLREIEQKYGSLILGQLRGAKERKNREEISKQEAKKVSFDEGLQVLTDTLHAKLGNAVHLNTAVTRVEQTADGWRVSARSGNGESSELHSAVLYAGTAYQLAELDVRGAQPLNLKPLAEVRYPAVASLVLGFRRDQVRHPLDGFGVLIAQIEKFHLLGALFSSSLFPNRAPAGHVTLTCYVGGVRQPELARLSTDELTDLAVKDLGVLLGVTGRPTFQHHELYRRAIPQYEVGYGRFKEVMNDAESKAPGFFIAGHFREGISLGDSILSGHNVVERISGFLGKSGAGTATPTQSNAVIA
jgi:oxygen-dependent protoporphyrinogen oxidase